MHQLCSNHRRVSGFTVQFEPSSGIGSATLDASVTIGLGNAVGCNNWSSVFVESTGGYNIEFGVAVACHDFSAYGLGTVWYVTVGTAGGWVNTMYTRPKLIGQECFPTGSYTFEPMFSNLIGCPWECITLTAGTVTVHY